MATWSRRFGLLAVVLVALSLTLGACATPSAPQLTQGPSGQINVFKTPDPKAGTPTPAFPGFTVGAWPSNYSPNNTEHIKIYILCRIQPNDMSKPPSPAAGITVDASFGPPVNTDVQKVTGADGLAVAEWDLVDPQSGLPVTVTVSASYGGVTYTTTTFFTPNPTALPTPTPNPNATTTPGATGTPSPTPGK